VSRRGRLFAWVVFFVAAWSAPAWAGANAASVVEARVRASIPGDFGIGKLRVPPSWKAGANDAIAVAWPSAPRAGWVNVQITITAESGARTMGWAQAELLPMRDVLIATRPLVAGEKIDPAALTTERRAAAAGTVTLSPPALADALVARDVAAGAALSEADVVMPPPVRQGAPVEIRLQHGPLVVTAEGVLERATHPGEQTSARIVAGGNLVYGRLADAHTLVIEELQ
jgi:flagella basal body P-ring formation protein FlgA